MGGMAQESEINEGGAVGADGAGVVDTDLACARCGYNLRTAAWAGVCPECGLAVERSRPIGDLRFESLQAVRRARAVVGFAVIVILLLAFAYLGRILWYWYVSRFWNEMQTPGSSARQFVDTFSKALGYSYTAAAWLLAAAGSYFALTVGPRGPAWKAWIPGLAFLGAVGRINALTAYAASYYPSVSYNLYIIWNNAADACLFLSVLPVWAYATTRLGKPHRILRIMMRIVFALIVLQLLSCIHDLTAAATGISWIQSGARIPVGAGPLAWRSALVRYQGAWQRFMESPLLLATAGVLWWYLRVLNRALRRAEGGGGGAESAEKGSKTG